MGRYKSSATSDQESDHAAAIARAVSRTSRARGLRRSSMTSGRASEGFSVHRVGYSSSIVLYWRTGRAWRVGDGVVEHAALLESAREAGYPFDDRGWLDTSIFKRDES